LIELAQRVAKWRELEGGRGSRIPGELWVDAVRVSRTAGVWATSKALHFNYQALQARAEEAAEDAESAAPGKGVRAQRPARKGAGRVGHEPVGAAQTEVVIAAKPAEAVPTNEIAGPRFIALEVGQLSGPSRTVIDLVGRQGDRMRVEVAGTVDVAGVVHAFWSRQP
jgi:hypothetical protein